MKNNDVIKLLPHSLLVGFLMMLFCLLPQTAFATSSGWTQIGGEDGCEWQISDYVLTIRPLDNGTSGYLENALPENYTHWPWYTSRERYTTVVIEEGVKARGTLYGMFITSSVETAYLNELDTSLVTDMNSMFAQCGNLKTVELSSWDTSNVTSMRCMFLSCKKLQALDCSNWDTSLVTDMAYMFSYCYDLESFTISDNWNTSDVTNMNSMFCFCESLKSLDVSKWDTSKVTNMCEMFYYCKALTKLDVSNWNTAEVTNMESMFHDCNSLQSLNLSSWNTSKVTRMVYMFSNCNKMTDITFSESFDTSNVTSMVCFFENCASLKKLTLPDSFNPCKVTSMTYFLDGCSSLESLTIPETFDTSKVIGMCGMFRSCSSLQSLTLPEAFNTSSADNMGFMFYGCSSLTSLTLPDSFDTSNVTETCCMFSSCSSLQTITLPSAFNTGNVTNMVEMFSDCTNLTAIYVDSNAWSTASALYTTDMFYYCKKLVGGMGTTYNNRKTDASYAVVDYGTDNPGYLSKFSQTLGLDGVSNNALIFKNIGDSSFTVTATGATTAVTYTSSNPNVATVDSTTGTVTILGNGITVITASAAETGTVYPAEASYTLSVATVAGGYQASDSQTLEEIARILSEENPGSSVDVWVEVNQNVSDTDKQAFLNQTRGYSCLYYEASLYATIDGQTSDIGDSNDIPVSITNTFDFDDRTDIHVYRLHNGAVDELTESPNSDGEYVKFDRANNKLTVTAAKYSAYCIAWKETSSRTDYVAAFWLYENDLTEEEAAAVDANPNTGADDLFSVAVVFSVVAIMATVGVILSLRKPDTDRDL